MIAVPLNVRAINQAVERNMSGGGGGGVYCQTIEGKRYRVRRAKTVKGQLLVLTFSDTWVLPVFVEREW